MPGEHARLSPSDAERWMSCPAAIRMDDLVPPEAESVYAREGTCAHGLAEIKARLAFDQIDTTTYARLWEEWEMEFADVLESDDFEMDEMDRHTDAYVDLVKERVALHPNSTVLFEQRMDTGVPQSWGTADTTIVSPIHVEIIDFKYGKGVAVEAEGNPQLRLYGCAALDTFGDMLGETEHVTCTVHQPRLYHVLSETLTAAELRAWRTDEVIPRAELALGDDAPFGPSDVASPWCPASGQCKAQLEAVFSVDFEQSADLLSPEEMAGIRPKVKMIQDWLGAFEVAALDMAYSQGKTIPGYKVVLSGGRRGITDEAALVEFLVSKGYSKDEVSRVKAQTFGHLEKLIGVAEFAELAKPYIKPPVGKPALVQEHDSRPAINPSGEAAKDFHAEDLL